MARFSPHSKYDHVYVLFKIINLEHRDEMPEKCISVEAVYENLDDIERDIEYLNRNGGTDGDCIGDYFFDISRQKGTSQ